MRKLVFLFGLAVMFATLAITSYAGVYAYRLNGGVSGRQYWIDPNATNLAHYESDIGFAIQSWNDTQASGTRISISRTYSYCCTSVADHYIKDYGQAWAGVTAFFHSDGTLAMPYLGAEPTSNYDYTEISIDNVQLASVFDLRVRATAAHEFGHAIGLSHSAVTCALMNEFVISDNWARCHTSSPRSDDINWAKGL